MPAYTSHCKECQNAGDVRLSFSDYDAITSGESKLVCNECEGLCEIVFDPSSVQFVLKDGVSGGWTSKAMKENAWRAEHREVMAKRERDHVFKPKLQPNYNGVETGTWRDAQECARAETSQVFGKEVGNLSASTYDPLVKSAK